MTIYFVLFCIIIVQRKYGLLINGSRIDSVFGLLIIMIGYEYISRIHWLRNMFEMLGQHSFNIFLFHTFIFYYYLPGFIYGFKYPVLILPVLLGLCLMISIILEKFKWLLRMGRVEEILLGHMGNLTIVGGHSKLR
jgi:fucose 4-O-acetylase-like acetyltransferase